MPDTPAWMLDAVANRAISLGDGPIDFGRHEEQDLAKARTGVRFWVVQPWPTAGLRIYDGLLSCEVGGAFYGETALEDCQKACDRKNAEENRRKAEEQASKKARRLMAEIEEAARWEYERDIREQHGTHSSWNCDACQGNGCTECGGKGWVRPKGVCGCYEYGYRGLG